MFTKPALAVPGQAPSGLGPIMVPCHTGGTASVALRYGSPATHLRQLTRPFWGYSRPPTTTPARGVEVGGREIWRIFETAGRRVWREASGSGEAGSALAAAGTMGTTENPDDRRGRATGVESEGCGIMGFSVLCTSMDDKRWPRGSSGVTLTDGERAAASPAALLLASWRSGATVEARSRRRRPNASFLRVKAA